jgi:DNA-binding transcriptional ArsR family regulator
MARAAASSDVFNAIADPTRRALLDSLLMGERPVGELVAATGASYPQTSQHLGVLLEVGAVTRRAVGRQRLYRLDAEPLSEVYEWTAAYKDFWQGRLARRRDYLDQHP